jgi:hypothetical protein
MAQVHCFYQCGVVKSTSQAMEIHYSKYHTPLKSYLTPEFTCDNCYKPYQGARLYSPARNREELTQSPHYCPSCVKKFQTQLVPTNLKPKNMKKPKKKTLKLKPRKIFRKKLTKKPQKSKTTTLTLKPIQKRIKNPLDYYECMKNCCLKKQKISQTARECKQNALVINSRMSASKKKAITKIRNSYQQLGAGLAEFIKSK